MANAEYLSRLVELIPAGEQPAEEHVREIIRTDSAIKGRRDELRRNLKRLEDEARHGHWFLGGEESFRYRSRAECNYGGYIGERRTKNSSLFEEEHTRRMGDLRAAVTGAEIEDGGLKSEERIITKLRLYESERRHVCVPDFSRVRVICEGLKDLEIRYGQLRNSWDVSYDQMGLINYYNNGITKYPSAFRGLNTYWIKSPEKATDMNTEIQFVTRRIRALLDLDHPFDVTRELEYPDAASCSWVRRLYYKASILDFQELLGKG